MEDELTRLASFSNSPATDNIINPLCLARIGFYYSAPPDFVTCCGCNVQFYQGTQLDELLQRHRQQASGCRFVLQASGQNIPPALPLLTVTAGENSTDSAQAEQGQADSLRSIFDSALARAFRKGVPNIPFQTFPDNTK